VNKQAYKKIQWITNITTPILIVILIGLLVTISVFYPIAKMGLISKLAQTLVYVGCFLTLVVLLLFYSIMIVSSGVVIVKSIRKTSQAVHSAVHTKHSLLQNPFAITFALLVGLLCCVVTELLAFGIGSAVTSDTEDYKFVWHFFNCAGVLIFAVIALLLFYPMFEDTDKVMGKITDSTKEKKLNHAHLEAPKHIRSRSISIDAGASLTPPVSPSMSSSGPHSDIALIDETPTSSV